MFGIFSGCLFPILFYPTRVLVMADRCAQLHSTQLSEGCIQVEYSIAVVCVFVFVIVCGHPRVWLEVSQIPGHVYCSGFPYHDVKEKHPSNSKARGQPFCFCMVASPSSFGVFRRAPNTTIDCATVADAPPTERHCPRIFYTLGEDLTPTSNSWT